MCIRDRALIVDTTPATVRSVSSSTSYGSFAVDGTIAVPVQFSEVVNVTGTPKIALETGSSDANVSYSIGTGTNTLTFNYEVATGHTSSDLDYLSTTALGLNGGTIKDVAGNDSILTLASPGASGSLGDNKDLVVDGSPPTVSSVSATTSNGTFAVGSAIAITVTFNENVTVTGTPQLRLETGAVDVLVDKSGASGAVVTFSYTVAADHVSSDLDYHSTSALTLNGGTIQDALSINATLTLPSPAGGGSLGRNKALVINGAALPVISGVSLAADNSSLTVTMSEGVYNSASNNGTGDLATTDFALSISGGDATVASTPSSFTLNNRHALSFDGTNDYVEIAHDNSLNLTDNFTIEAWVNLNSNSNNTIIDKGNYRNLFQVHTSGNTGLSYYDSTNNWTHSSGTIPTNEWVHVAMSFQTGSNNLKFYKNGQLMSSHTLSNTSPTDTGVMNIGRQSPLTCLCNILDGNLDELRIWSDIRTQSEIQAKKNLSLTGSEAGLVGYWNFNQGSGTTLTDQTSNNNDGTITVSYTHLTLPTSDLV